ncbi:MAG: type II toxin-antitoxin system VapC family toxin [Desulfobacterales bacterium]|nr:type II toxin-antitoxin system VapC family toxin [Desulfobacterales bacterium]
MYLLDTDTLIYSLKGDKVVHGHLERHVDDPMFISAVTLMELYYGAHKSQQVAGNLAKVKTIEDAFEIISPGKDTAEIFGMLKASLEFAGTPLDDFDLVIAAIALSRNLTLVTNNTRHFSRIQGLKLANWAQPVL